MSVLVKNAKDSVKYARNMLKYAVNEQLSASNMQVFANNMQEICKKKKCNCLDCISRICKKYAEIYAEICNMHKCFIIHHPSNYASKGISVDEYFIFLT